MSLLNVLPYDRQFYEEHLADFLYHTLIWCRNTFLKPTDMCPCVA